jgi:hypothetical protein
VPIDVALEELLLERPGGDEQIRRVRNLHDQMSVLQGEMDVLSPIQPFSESHPTCQKLFRYNIEACRLLELAIVRFVGAIFRKAGAEFALAEQAHRAAFAWIDVWETLTTRPDGFGQA